MNDLIETSPETTYHAPTPLAEFLLLADSSGDRCNNHTQGAGPDDLAALLGGAGALDLGSISQIFIIGSDRVRWLNGMLTNNIQSLEEGRGNYNFILNAQGRIQGDGYVYRQGERLLLHTDHGQVRRLLDHLDRYIIMDDVELQVATECTALGLVGPQASRIFKALGLTNPDLEPLTLMKVEIDHLPVTLIRSYGVASPHYQLWFEREHVGTIWQALIDAGATPCGAAAAEALRILEGLPAFGVDLHDRDLAQETGQTRALNFTKGCYLGQEIVERIRSRGNVHRAFRRMELRGALPVLPAELRANGKVVGHITSAAKVNLAEGASIRGIGFVRPELLASTPLSAKPVVEYDGGQATILSADSAGS